MGKSDAQLKEAIRKTLSEGPKTSLFDAMKRGRDQRAAAIAARPNGDGFRGETRAIKIDCLERQEELIEQFSENARKRGAKVVRAKDGAEAIKYILDLAKRKDAKSISKSKSLTTEEIDVNRPLEENGIRIVETDLGELILQLCGEQPFHLVFPSVHKTAQEVADIFIKETGEQMPPDPLEIMKVVRRYLRPIFLNADIGMTGANVGIAETGAIVIETNEGNARLVSSIPDVHICVMGQEKIVGTTAEGLKMALAHPISATGQTLTTYVTFMAGRAPLGEGNWARTRESHIIVLDNGRTAMRQDPAMSDALNCIRCGACMNVCPTYGVVGGHTFGHIYPGPIGIPWTAGAHGLKNAADFAPLCISCGLCKEICPVEIDIPMMIAEIKDRASRTHPQPVVNRAMMGAETMSKMGSAFAPLSNWLIKNKMCRSVMEKTIGVDRSRVLPSFSRKTLIKQFRKRPPPKIRGFIARRVALFVDVFANYNEPRLGMAAIERLERLGCEVVLPKQKWSGYPYIGYGNLKAARKIAKYNVASFAEYIRNGFDVVSIEPTATYCLRHSYPKLLDFSNESKALARRTYELFEYLQNLELEDPAESASEMHKLHGKRVGFHPACHQRPLGGGQHVMRWLRRRGAEVELIETGTCCGMAGTFGMKTGPLGIELSKAVGEPLFKLFKEAGIDAIVTESSVCKMQLLDGTGIEVYHPLSLLELPGYEVE